MASEIDALSDSVKSLTLQQSKEDVEKKFKSLTEMFKKYCPSPRKRNITVFYHVTSKENKQKIMEARQLKKNVAEPLSGKPDTSPLYQMKLEGVFFTINLDKHKDQLPSTSPYGTERVKIPITEFSEYKLFFNTYYHNIVYGSLIFYVVLVLVKEDHERYKEIEAALPKLDDLTKDTTPVIEYSIPQPFYNDRYNLIQKGKSFNAYFEVFVVGNVPLGNDAKWDTVKKTGKEEDEQAE